MRTEQLTHPGIERTQRHGYARPEPQAISGTVQFCIVLMIEAPRSVDALLTTHAAEVVGDFAVDHVTCDYEDRCTVEVRIDADAECQCKDDLKKEARERLRELFRAEKKRGRMASVRDMEILDDADVTID